MWRFAPLSIILSFFVFLFFFPVNVYAEDYNEMWAYYFAETYGGVDFSQYKDTDEGSSLSEIWERYGTTQFDNTVDFYADSMKNAVNAEGFNEYATNQIDITSDYAKNTFRNTVTTTDSVNSYIGERVRRTVVDGGRQFFDVSGDEWFNSIYNDLFNNGGYKQQYEQVTNNNTVTGNINGSSVSLTCEMASDVAPTGSYNYFITIGLRSELVSSPGNAGMLLTWNIDGVNWFCWGGSVPWLGGTCSFNSVTFAGNQINTSVHFVNGSWEGDRSYTYYLRDGGNENNYLDPAGGEIAKPSSCGVINYNGQWLDVPTDPNELPEGWEITPDGHVLVNGTPYDIYIEEDPTGVEDPTQLTPDGVWQVLKNIGDTPFGNNFNNHNGTYNDPDGNNNNNPFGLSIKDFFDNIGKGVGNAIASLFGGALELLKKLIEKLSSLFSLNFLSSMHLDLDLHFTFITDLFNTLLSLLGVAS